MSEKSGGQEMNQDDRRKYLIKGLLKERLEYENMQIPEDASEQKMLLRLLMNIRMPGEMDHAFLQIQDAYLSEENEKKGIVTLADIREIQPDLSIWKGDITRLKVGAIVNAANSGMKSIGNTGVDISILIDIWMRQNRYIRTCMS